MSNVRPMYQMPAYNPPALPLQNTKQTIWTTHTDPNGRKYYYNTITKQSSWEKPEELKTPLEKALSKCHWKEYTSNGKKYYYNEETKVSSWEMPQEYKDFLAKIESQKNKPDSAVVPSATPAIKNDTTKSNSNVAKPVSEAPTLKTTAASENPLLSNNKSVIIQGNSVVIDFKSKEEAEEAFKKLLKDSGVKSNWTWKDAILATGHNPMYHCLKTAEERKTAFMKYIDQCKREEREEERIKLQKEREEFRAVLKLRKDITSTTRYRKYAENLKDEPTFLAIADERDRESIFNEYISDLRRKEKDKLRMLRKENMEKLRQILRKLPINYNTLWKDAQILFKTCSDYADDEQLQTLDPLDVFSVYEDHIKYLEDQYNDMKEKQRMERRREERKNRDAFKELLKELRNSHVINIRSKWKEIYPYIQNDPRYLNMLGQSGSTPLELFWDTIQRIEDDYYQEKRTVMELIKTYDIKITPDLNFPVFLSKLPMDRLKGIEEAVIHLVYDDCVFKSKLKQREEKRKEEKRLKKKMDMFKYVLKKVSPPITIYSTWEEVKPLIETKPESQVLTEENRIEVFNKFIKRLKEKEEIQSEEEGSIIEDKERSRKRKKYEKEKERDKKRRHYHYHYDDYEDEKKLYKKRLEDRMEEPEDGELC
jgi:pre-mRNA-processing factor 40